MLELPSDVRPIVWSGSEQGRIRMQTRELHGRGIEARDSSSEDGVTNNFKGSGREGHAGGRPHLDGMPWLDDAAMVHQV